MKRFFSLIPCIEVWFFFGLSFLVWNAHGIQTVSNGDGWAKKVDIERIDALSLSSRVFGGLYRKVAHSIDPYSFVGDSLLLAVLVLISAILLFYLLKEIFRGAPAIPFVATSLYILSPWEYGVFWLVSTPIWAAQCFALLAILLYVKNVAQPSNGKRLGYSLAIIMALLTYPIYLPIFVLLPVVIYMLNQNGIAYIRQEKNDLILWIILVVLCALFIAIMDIVFGSRNTVTSDFDLISIYEGYLFSIEWLSFSWIEKFHFIGSTGNEIILQAIVLLAAFYCLSKLTDGIKPWKPSKVVIIAIIAGSLLIWLVGYAPFSVSDQRFMKTRVYIIASIGSVVLLPMLIYLLFSKHVVKNQNLFSIIGALLISMFFSNEIALAKQRKVIPDANVEILGQIIQQAPRIKSSSIIFLDCGIRDLPPNLARRPHHPLTFVYFLGTDELNSLPIRRQRAGKMVGDIPLRAYTAWQLRHMLKNKPDRASQILGMILKNQNRLVSFKCSQGEIHLMESMEDGSVEALREMSGYNPYNVIERQPLLPSAKGILDQYNKLYR